MWRLGDAVRQPSARQEDNSHQTLHQTVSWSWISNFQTERNTFLWFKSPSLWHFFMAAGTDYYTSFSKFYFRLISPKWHVLSDHSTFVSETVLFLKDLYNFHLKQQALVFTLSSSPNCFSFLWHLVQNPIKLVHKQMPFFSINLAKDSLMTHCNTFLGIQEYRTSLKWQPTPVFLPGESHGQRGLVGYSPGGRKESDMTEQLTHTHTAFLETVDNMHL